MAAAKKCIITGRNQVNDVFYMLNEDTTDTGNVWYTGGKEKQVRTECKKKIFDSKSEADAFAKFLRNESNSWDTKWFVEYDYQKKINGRQTKDL
jgi:hypothetical protein